jgi:hypothetical protein
MPDLLIRAAVSLRGRSSPLKTSSARISCHLPSPPASTMALQSMFALAMLLPVTLASPALNPAPIGAALPARRDGTAHYRIHPSGDSTLCLCAHFPWSTIGVFVQPCDSTTEGYTDVWQLQNGDNLSVTIGGIGHTEWCLDAGSTPENNGLVDLGTCDPGLQQQQCVLSCPHLGRPTVLTEARL